MTGKEGTLTDAIWRMNAPYTSSGLNSSPTPVSWIRTIVHKVVWGEVHTQLRRELFVLLSRVQILVEQIILSISVSDRYKRQGTREHTLRSSGRCCGDGPLYHLSRWRQVILFMWIGRSGNSSKLMQYWRTSLKYDGSVSGRSWSFSWMTFISLWMRTVLPGGPYWALWGS